MNRPILRNPPSNSKGISLIEILLGLAVLVIMLSFAVPSAAGAVIKAELSVAVENVQYSMHVARQTARINEKSIAMTLISDKDTIPSQSITFAATEPKNNGLVQIQDFNIPPEIMLISDQDSYIFDERGLVKNPGAILLVSREDESITSTININ